MSSAILYSSYFPEAFSKKPEPSHLCREARPVQHCAKGLRATHTHALVPTYQTCARVPFRYTHTHALLACHNMHTHQTHVHIRTPNAHMTDPCTHVHTYIPEQSTHSCPTSVCTRTPDACIHVCLAVAAVKQSAGEATPV